MTTPRVSITRSELPGAGIERLARLAELNIWEDKLGPASSLGSFLDGSIAALTLSGDRVDGSVLDQCPSLKMIGQASAGFDNLALDQLSAHGVVASNAPGVLQETTADYTWGLYFAIQRRIVEADRMVRAGGWKDPTFDLLLGRDLFGSTLGIVGYGQIGTAVARRASGFGMRVIHFDPVAGSDEHSTLVGFEELLATADIVSVHVALTDHTRSMFDTAAFQAMKPTAVLVNVSRGPVVDQTALVDALGRGLIAGAALDVYEHEPIAADDPLIGFDNCVLSPHIASASSRTRTKMVDVAVDNIVAFLTGESPPNALNPDAGPSRQSQG